jgi:chemotaxis protein MotB
MAGHGGSGGRRKRRGDHGGDHADERWLLTYADMLTLMFALFMVLFSISSVNISKYQVLQQSLKAAFSGSVLPGGRSILRSGSESTSAHTPATAEVPSIVPLQPTQSSKSATTSAGGSGAVSHCTANAGSEPCQVTNAMAAAAAANAEQEHFLKLKAKLDAYAKAHGFSKQVQTQITRSGLVINVLTDKLLFDSGSAVIKVQGVPLLDEVAQLLNVDRTHPITVAGHTDNQPISTAEYHSNWQLSTDRATNVVLFLIAHGVGDQRLGAAGYADLHPIASNATPAGRAKNRRVEILLQRLNPYPTL